MSCWGHIGWKTCFWEIWVEFKCFWKTFNLILMHFIHEILCYEEFLHKIALIFKNLIVPDFWSIKPVSRPIEIAIKFFCLNLPVSISSRSMLDRLKMKNFQFPSLWPNFFFHASFMFRIHMHCIDFLYPSCSFAVISLVVFTHNMHTLC